jgi:hypothetical protein
MLIEEGLAGATYDPKPAKMPDSGATSDISLDIPKKAKDADPVESAS